MNYHLRDLHIDMKYRLHDLHIDMNYRLRCMKFIPVWLTYLGWKLSSFYFNIFYWTNIHHGSLPLVIFFMYLYIYIKMIVS